MVYIKECLLTSEKDCFQLITIEINKAINESKVVNGFVVIEAISEGVGILKISSKASEVVEDVYKEMRKIVPARINYKYQESPESAAANIKSSLFGCSLALIIKDGRLLCEDSQDVYFADYDGPQNRNYSILVYGE